MKRHTRVDRRAFAFGLAVLALAVALTAGAAGAGTTGPVIPSAEFTPNFEVDRATPAVASNSNAPRVIPANASNVVSSNPGLTGFNGLNLIDTRTADGRNAYSVEPPDQGLCSNGTQVLEAVNSIFAVYDTAGNLVSGKTSLNSFFTGDVAINRATGVAGQFLSDPKCYWDSGNGHWYFSVLGITNGFTQGRVFLAVSKGSTATADPAGWYHYSIDTTNAGGAANDSDPSRTLPSHPGCPCFGDQPLIGADAYGFYVTTNEFSINGPNFNGAQVYALDKNGLAKGKFRMQYVAGYHYLPLAEGYSYSLQPATSPTAASWEQANGGTEYLLSALDFNATTDNRVAAWALVNTQSLESNNPSVRLLDPAIVSSETYGQPPVVKQEPGPTPLADAFGAHESTLNSNDDRMNQVVYAGGRLWSGVNTAITTANTYVSSADRTGIAWFAVSPSASSSTITASMASQGYIALGSNDSVMFPSLGINDKGTGVMTFTISGVHYYPSAGYVTIGANGTGDVHIAAAGTMPADGFTGVPAYGGPPERWGDYSAATALPDGSVLMATEWIPGTFSYATGGWFANWGTYVMRVNP